MLLGLLISLFPIAMATSPYPLDKLHSILQQTEPMRQYRISQTTPNIPLSAYQKVSAGTVTTGLQGQTGWGIGIFKIGIQEMFAAINQEEAHVSLSPVDFTKVIQGQPCTNNRLVMMHLPIPMLSDRWWVTKQRTNAPLRSKSDGRMAELTWEAVDDRNQFSLDSTSQTYTNDAVWVTQSSGAWLLIKLDEEHTLGEYHAWSKPGGYIPSGLAASLGASGIEQTFAAMESFAQNNQEECSFNW